MPEQITTLFTPAALADPAETSALGALEVAIDARADLVHVALAGLDVVDPRDPDVRTALASVLLDAHNRCCDLIDAALALAIHCRDRADRLVPPRPSPARKEVIPIATA